MRFFFFLTVLKNIPIMEPSNENENVPTAYSTSIMEKGKTDEDIRGPAFFQDLK